MPVPDLRYVTRVLTRTIQEYVRTSPIWGSSTAPTVSSRPPDQAADADLSLFLYHVARDPSLTSILPPSPETAPHFAPLGLILSYQLTAHPQGDDDAAAEGAQIALSAAMMGLQEFSVIGPGSRPGGVDVFGDIGVTDSNVRFNVTMQPVSRAEAVGFWTPGDSAPRLAAYYQVSAQIEPPPVTRIGPRVLSYGVGVFGTGEPRLYASEARLDLPRADGGVEAVVLRPAEVPYGGRVTFVGGNLGGDRVALVIEADGWDDPVTVGAEWAVQVRNGEISASPSPSAEGRDVPPGMYRGKALVIRNFTDETGALHEVEFVSNPMAFFVTPAADALSGPAGGIFTITGRGFAPPGGQPGDAALTIFGQPLTLGAGANPAAGEFVVDGDTQIRFSASATLPTGQPLPVRVLIRGASAPPLWVTL